MSTITGDEKLQKVLARAGYGSRRLLETWIAAGRVSVNGKRAQLGDRVTAHDTLRVDGVVVAEMAVKQGRTRVLAYHKPAGEICARRDPEGRRTVFESLPGLRNGRWIAVGRLDISTSGLLLFTSNGELAHKLMHPSSQIAREYAVRVLGQPDAAALRALTEGVELDGQTARFDEVRKGGGEGANQWYTVTLKEGRYREVRRLWESQGLVVSRLIRVRYGDITLPRDLRAGKWMELEPDVVALLTGTAPEPFIQRPKAKAHKRRSFTPSRSAGSRPARPGRTASPSSRRDRRPKR